MSSARKNEECFLAILGSVKRPLHTAEILQLTDQFPELCSGCKSGSDVIAAGMRLVRKDGVKRTTAKGGFLWSLV